MSRDKSYAYIITPSYNLMYSLGLMELELLKI